MSTAVRRAPRSARVVVVILLWILRTVASLLVACPVLLAISSSGLVNGPEHDAFLFQPGALGLLELLRTSASALASSAKTSLVLGGLCTLLGLVPLATALELLQSEDMEGIGPALTRGFRVFPRFLGLSVIALLAQAALLLASSLFGTALSGALRGHDERVLTLAPLILVAIGLLSCAWVGAVLDLARALVIQRDLGARHALLAALERLREQPLSVLFGSYPSTAGSMFAWLTAVWLMTKLDLTVPSTRVVVLAFVLHQAAVVFGIALRVRWLRGALALAAHEPSARS